MRKAADQHLADKLSQPRRLRSPARQGDRPGGAAGAAPRRAAGGEGAGGQTILALGQARRPEDAAPPGAAAEPACSPRSTRAALLALQLAQQLAQLTTPVHNAAKGTTLSLVETETTPFQVPGKVVAAVAQELLASQLLRWGPGGEEGPAPGLPDLLGDTHKDRCVVLAASARGKSWVTPTFTFTAHVVTGGSAYYTRVAPRSAQALRALLPTTSWVWPRRTATDGGFAAFDLHRLLALAFGTQVLYVDGFRLRVGSPAHLAYLARDDATRRHSGVLPVDLSPRSRPEVAPARGRLAAAQGRAQAAVLRDWEEKGDALKGLQSCHCCPGGDNKACIRLYHVGLGSRSTNAYDMQMQKGKGNPQAASRRDRKRGRAEGERQDLLQRRLQFKRG